MTQPDAATPSPLVRLAHSPAADWLRRKRARFDNIEVRQARTLAGLVRAGQVDVVSLGDSTSAYTASYDADPRPVHVMLQDELGPDVSMHAIHSGGFKPQ